MPAPVCGEQSPHTVFFWIKKKLLSHERGVIVDKEAKMYQRIALKRMKKTPMGTYVPTQHSTANSIASIKNNVYQEMALNQRARANARSGNTLLASWMQESADRFATLREQNREPNIPTTVDHRTRRNTPLMWDGYCYDVQGELLYDDEVM